MKIKTNPDLRGHALAVEVLAHIELAEREGSKFDRDAGRTMPAWNQGSWGDLSTGPTPEVEEALREWVREYGFQPMDLEVAQATTGLPENANACGTAFCAAGWAEVLTGQVIHWRGEFIPEQERVEWTMHRAGPRQEPISLHAADLLDLAQDGSADEPAWPEWCSNPPVFDATNDLDELYILFARHYAVTEEALRLQVQERTLELIAVSA